MGPFISAAKRDHLARRIGTPPEVPVRRRPLRAVRVNRAREVSCCQRPRVRHGGDVAALRRIEGKGVISGTCEIFLRRVAEIGAAEVLLPVLPEKGAALPARKHVVNRIMRGVLRRERMDFNRRISIVQRKLRTCGGDGLPLEIGAQAVCKQKIICRQVGRIARAVHPDVRVRDMRSRCQVVDTVPLRDKPALDITVRVNRRQSRERRNCGNKKTTDLTPCSHSIDLPLEIFGLFFSVYCIKLLTRKASEKLGVFSS